MDFMVYFLLWDLQDLYHQPYLLAYITKTLIRVITPWMLPPLGSSCVIFIIEIYKALDSSPVIDCYSGLYGGSTQ